jgi:cyanophycinase
MTRIGLTAILTLASLTALTGAPPPKFDYFLTGSADNFETAPQFGLGLMGGGTDVDALFTWMRDLAGGGDFVVIRASGADGYNQYVYDFGGFDSVETLVLKNATASSDQFVLDRILGADALFIAGGDQSNYVNFWKNTPVEDAIHELAGRGVPIGGTSAGTAILGELLYSAQRKSVTSAAALVDPFSRDITLDREFLVLPHLAGVITDQHLIERDRLGRTLTFMARLLADGWTTDPRAIAIDRETAVLVTADGHATIVANQDHPTPYAYFLRGGVPSVVSAKTPLTYTGVEVKRASPGSTFDLGTWTGTALTEYVLNVNSGVVSSTQPGDSIY